MYAADEYLNRPFKGMEVNAMAMHTVIGSSSYVNGYSEGYTEAANDYAGALVAAVVVTAVVTAAVVAAKNRGVTDALVDDVGVLIDDGCI